MLSVDQQLYKAAAIDGASKGKQFFSVTLPSIRKTVSFLVTMGLINGIKVFPLALFNNDPNAAALNGGSSLMLMVYKFVNEGNFALAGAASITLFVIGVVVSYSLRKIVALTFKASLKIGEMNVLNKIESTSFKPKALFKI
jgi:ABC transport permease protein